MKEKISKAAVVREFGKELSVENIKIPDHIEPNSILVKTEVASICGTDVHLWEGSLNLKVDLPVILGHEMVGTVIKMGNHVKSDSMGNKLEIGDRIVWAHESCGNCYYCSVVKNPNLCVNRRQYMYASCEKEPFLLGGFSEYGYVLPNAGRVKVPDNVTSELASLSSCAFRSVMNAFEQLGNIEPHQTVIIQGVGPLGLLATAVAHHAGAHQIIAIGAPYNRLELAKEFGASHTFSLEEISQEVRYKEIMSLTDHRGGDIVFEFSGNARAFAEGLNLIGKDGRYVIVGQLGQGEVSIQPSIITKKNIKIFGSYSGDISHYWKALNFISKNQSKYAFEKLLTSRYKLSEVTNALKDMKTMKEIKPIIEFS